MPLRNAFYNCRRHTDLGKLNCKRGAQRAAILCACPVKRGAPIHDDITPQEFWSTPLSRVHHCHYSSHQRRSRSGAVQSCDICHKTLSRVFALRLTSNLARYQLTKVLHMR
jgi:hypothetical protein